MKYTIKEYKDDEIEPIKQKSGNDSLVTRDNWYKVEKNADVKRHTIQVQATNCCT